MQYTYFQLKRIRHGETINNIKILILAAAITLAAIMSISRISELQRYAPILPQEDAQVQIDVPKVKTPAMPQELTIYRVVAERTREISAYNAGDPSQTDNSPCIGASGVDICNLLDHGICVYAANFVPLGTYLDIEGESCQVLDRMNSKYNNRVDKAMKLSEKDAAIKFGIKKKVVRVIKK